ncbi:P-type conjugative transfer protein TrbJ [Inquilinus sp. NPDC058860]|uniref:P-type conjugative transfer protein TrbJ n=1 Tax=Inquilinus sp. NPDC058860 TaxID=3346652 RepID=UPI00368A8927
MMSRRLGAALIAGALLSLPAASDAAWIVFDPRNYSENLLSAARALEQIQNQVTSLQNEAQMLMNQARQLASLPTSVLGEIQGSFSEIQGLLRQADRIAYDAEAIEDAFRQYRDLGSDLSDQQLIAGARQRWQTSVSAFQHALTVGAGVVNELPATQAETSTLVDASQGAVGVLQATQAGNQLLAVQTKQLADLTALLAAQGRAQALEQARQAAAEQQAAEQRRRFLAEGVGYQPSAVSMFHE